MDRSSLEGHGSMMHPEVANSPRVLDHTHPFPGALVPKKAPPPLGFFQKERLVELNAIFLSHILLV